MKIILTNIVATVVQATAEENGWLWERLSYPDPSARHRRGRSDGFIHLYNRITNEFPAGFIRIVVAEGKEQGFAVQVADRRVRPCGPVDADLTWLRDYQLDAVHAAAARTRGVLWCPTGSGKTEIAIGLAEVLPCTWLFLAPGADLVNQAAARYELRTGGHAGVMADGKWTPSGRFNVATFQTFHRRLKKGDPEAKRMILGAQGLLIDEVHQLPASSFFQVTQQASNAYFRIGLSGTPLLRDEKSQMVIAATGPVAYRIHAQTLIDAGVLSKPNIRMIPCVQSYTAPRSLGPALTKGSSRARAKLWADAVDRLVVNSTKRNELIARMAVQAEKPSLVFVQKIEHGMTLLHLLRSMNQKAEFVNGSDTPAHRTAAIKRLEYGEIDTLICTVVFKQGIDIPTLASVVIGDGGKSAIAALQRVGRGMRRPEGKAEFEVWDIADRGTLLEKHAEKRRKAYGIEGYEVTTGPG